MSYIYTDKIVSSAQARARLEKLKEEEAKIKFYSKRISPTTVVYCKHEERLEEYDKIYNKKENFYSDGR